MPLVATAATAVAVLVPVANAASAVQPSVCSNPSNAEKEVGSVQPTNQTMPTPGF